MWQLLQPLVICLNVSAMSTWHAIHVIHVTFFAKRSQAALLPPFHFDAYYCIKQDVLHNFVVTYLGSVIG